MPDDSPRNDAEIIRAAYAERVCEAFKIFAESLATGESEQASTMRFRRAMDLVRKTRDLALQAAGAGVVVEAGLAEARLAAGDAAPAEPLSAEDQALVDQALAGTTGHMPAPPSRGYRGR
jgi:hypothetical protein